MRHWPTVFARDALVKLDCRTLAIIDLGRQSWPVGGIDARVPEDAAY